MKKDYSVIVERIEQLCNQKNVSINAVLQECKLNKSVIDNMKKGSAPSIDKIQVLADYFNVSTDYLLCKTNNPTPLGRREELEPGTNVIRILGRDGSRIERVMTDEQIEAISKLIDQMPDVHNKDL